MNKGLYNKFIVSLTLILLQINTYIHTNINIYIYIESDYDALQSTETLCALHSIFNFKSEMIDSNHSI
jgi:hypothetical protein